MFSGEFTVPRSVALGGQSPQSHNAPDVKTSEYKGTQNSATTLIVRKQGHAPSCVPREEKPDLGSALAFATAAEFRGKGLNLEQAATTSWPWDLEPSLGSLRESLSQNIRLSTFQKGEII